MLSKIAKGILGLNAAVLVRAMRFGPRDAAQRLSAGFRSVNPFERVIREAASAARTVKLGGYEVTVPPPNPLYEWYRNNPRYNSEIARVAAAVWAKYPGMMAVDVGANIGDTAALIRGACPAPILCVEGDQALANVLAENAARLGNVRPVHTFVGERREERLVAIAKDGWNSTLIPAADSSGVSVAFATLDELIEAADRPRIKLLKIDTEGHERRVLRGATDTLREGRPVVLFEHNREALSAMGDDSTAIFSELRDLGYRESLFWDAEGRFLLGASLEDAEIIEDLHDYTAYVGRQLGQIYYLDVCVFHEDDRDLAEGCLAAERVERDAGRSVL
jgi:FkbM family methyltransferase